MDAFTHDDESAIGGPFDFVGDIAKGVGKIAEGAVDALGDVVKAIPGGEWILDGVGTVTGAVGDFVTGPMRAFAKTGVGETIFRAASIAMSQALYVVPGVGYTLGFLAWSIPGLAKGEPFDAALTKEFIYRCQEVARFFAGKAGEEAGKAMSTLMGDQLKVATEKLGQLAKDSGVNIHQVANTLGIGPKSLAEMLGIREDVAAYAIAWAERKGQSAIDAINADADVETGKLRVKRIGKGKFSEATLASSFTTIQPKTTAQKAVAKIVPMAFIKAEPLTGPAAKQLEKITKTVATQLIINNPSPNPKIIEAAKAVDDKQSNKLSIAAGLGAAVIGTGVSLLAGLSTAVAAPVGIGFGIGSGVVTKLLTMRK